MTKARMPKRILAQLREARKAATFENANFGWGHAEVSGDVVKVDTLVKEKSQIYRKTWLLPRLDEVINWAEGGETRRQDLY